MIRKNFDRVGRVVVLCLGIIGGRASAQIGYTGPDNFEPVQLFATEVFTDVTSDAKDTVRPGGPQRFQVTAIGGVNQQQLFWNTDEGKNGHINLSTSFSCDFHFRGLELYQKYFRDRYGMVAYIVGTYRDYSAPGDQVTPVVWGFRWDGTTFVPGEMVFLTPGRKGIKPALAQDYHGGFVVAWQSGNRIMASHFKHDDASATYLTIDKAPGFLQTSVTTDTTLYQLEDLDVATNDSELYKVAWTSFVGGQKQINVFHGNSLGANFYGGISQRKRTLPMALLEDGRISVAMPTDVAFQFAPEDSYALAYVERNFDSSTQKVMVDGRYRGAEYTRSIQVNNLNGEQGGYNTAPRIDGGANFYEVGWAYNDRNVGFISGSNGSLEFLSRGLTTMGTLPAVGFFGQEPHRCLNARTRYTQGPGDIAVGRMDNYGTMGIAFFDYQGEVDVFTDPDPTPRFLGTKLVPTAY